MANGMNGIVRCVEKFYETETTGWYAKEVLKEMHPESMIEVVAILVRCSPGSR